MVCTNANAEEEQAMTTSVGPVGYVMPAWRELEAKAPVKLRSITSDRHYRAMVKFMNELLDAVGDDESHPLAGLLDIVAAFLHEYEELKIELPRASPADVLHFLMEQNDLRQADLAEIFGAQSNVSEILSGKREINARQARLLGERFGVSPAAFI
jgi:HTH-type transcriptional regulator/antitoxin HigA